MTLPSYSSRAIPEEFLQSISNKRLYSLRSDLYAFRTLSKTRTALKALQTLNQPIFIISIPGTLHLVELCLRFIPQSRNVVIINNGLSDWEVAFVRDRLARTEILNIPRLLEHGYVIDLLLAGLHQTFSILDFDCFIIDPVLFSEMAEIPTGRMMNALFTHYNDQLNLYVPQTFMLTFDPQVIHPLQMKYHAPSKKQDLSIVSGRVRRKLMEIGVNPDHYPLEYMAYFDTLHLWYSLGVADGLKPNFVRNYPDNFSDYNEVIHVGSSSSNNKTHARYHMRGSYFWRRALEECPYPQLIAYYLSHFGSASSRELLQQNLTLASQFTSDFFTFIEEIIHKSPSGL